MRNFLYTVFLCLGGGGGGGGGSGTVYGKLRTTSLYWCLEEKPYWSSLLPFHLSSSAKLSSLLHPSITSCFMPHFPCSFAPLHPTFFFPTSPSFSQFLPLSFCLSSLDSLRRLGKAGTGSSLVLRQWNTSKSKSSTNLTNFSHTHIHANTARQTGHSSCRLHRIPRFG